MGSPKDVVKLARKYELEHVLVVSRCLPGHRLRELLHQCRAAGLKVRMVRSADEWRNGSRYWGIRDIEINDLLQREPIQLDRQAISRMIRGRRVMVTGAGGSIGSEICRQVLQAGPERLILAERSENGLFHIHQELARLPGGRNVVPRIADVGHRERMARIFDRFRPELVFHAAAYKHVPMMEENPGEAIANNVFGTQTVADLADQFAVERFVMISTDKAVHPASVMGVSKRLAERYVGALAAVSATRLVVVRFGNVLGSTGSVVPIFQEQIRRGGPVTVTHPDVFAYMWSLHPSLRTDAVYARLLEKLDPRLAALPWDRTSRGVGRRTVGVRRGLRREFHAYQAWMEGPV